MAKKSKISLNLSELSAQQIEQFMKKKGALLRICVQNGLAEVGSFPDSDDGLKQLVRTAWEKEHGISLTEALNGGGDEEAEESQAPEPAPESEPEKVVEDEEEEEEIEVEEKPKSRKKRKSKTKKEEPNTEDSYMGVIKSIDAVGQRLAALENTVNSLSKSVLKMASSAMSAEALLHQAEALKEFTKRMMDIAGPELFGDLFDDDDDDDEEEED